MFCNRAEAFFVLNIYNRIRNTCDLRTIINTVGQLLLKLIRYKHRLILLEPRNYPFFYVDVILCYDLSLNSDLKFCHDPPFTPHPYLPYPPLLPPLPLPPQKKNNKKTPKKQLLQTNCHVIQAILSDP